MVLGSQVVLPVRPRWADLTTDALHRSGYSAGQRFVNGRSGGGRPPPFWDLVVVDEIRGCEDEDLAHDVRILLVTAHESDHLPAGRLRDDRLEALACSP